MKKFYHAQNAARGLIGGAVFDIYGTFAGSAFGVYATEDATQLAALDALVKDPRSAVTEISEAEYNVLMEKKKLTPAWDSYPSLRPPSPPPEMPLKGDVAAVVVESAEESVEEETTVEIKASELPSSDVVQVGKVT